MASKLTTFLRKSWASFLLTIVLVVIFFSNYTPGTWLAGWDNLMPELNILMNIKRSFLAVWQEYQGLGLVGGMGHAADLVRQLILLPFIYFLPTNMIRYLWHFGMIALGSSGVYLGLKRLSLSKNSRLLGAFFYLLNFGTIQYFWPPFECFSTFWGFFPWLIFLFWDLLKNSAKKNWLLFGIFNLLAIPSFYNPTLFVVYLTSLILVAIVSFLEIPHSKNELIEKENLPKKIKKSLMIILLVNAFWLLPFVYFFFTNRYHPQLAMINQMSSEETFLRNLKRGNLVDFLLLRGYYYDFPDGEAPMMLTWQNHFNKPWVPIIGLLLSSVSLLGILAALINFFKSRQDPTRQTSLFGIASLSIWLMGAIGLLSATVPFSLLNQLLRASPFLDQVFRSPFTKFVVPAAFSTAILFSLGVEMISRFIKKFSSKIKLLPVFLLILFAYSFPVFQGNFLYPLMRIKIPEEYFQLINFFKNQPKNSRIANLPQGNYWGWTFYRWGLRGSGFLWYGIEQPILDRTFDVWNLSNEQYYWELNYALQNQDLKLLENVFEKYFVEFIIFDDNVIFLAEKEYAKQALKTKELLTQSKRLKKVATFDQIDVYHFNQTTKPQLVTGELTSTYPLHFHQEDPIYEKYAHYLVETEQPDLFYPFGELFTSRGQKEIKFEINETESAWLISRSLPNFLGEEYQLKMEASLLPQTIPLNPREFLTKAGEEISLQPQEFINPHQCAPQKEDAYIDFKNDEKSLELKAKKAALCVSWQNYDFFKKYKNPVVVTIEFNYQSSTDEWPQYCLWDEKNKECLNSKDLPSKGFTQKWEGFSESLFYDPKQSQIVGLTFILDAYQQEEAKQINYQDIKIKINHLSQPVSLIASQNPYEVEQTENTLVVKIPKVASPWYIDNPIATNLFKLQPKSCNPSLIGDYHLKALKEGEKQFIRFSSQNADSCFSWYFPQLPLNQGWLVELEYRHQKTYPLLVAAFDGQSRYKFFSTKLEKNKDWQKAYFVIPPFSEIDKGIAVYFSNVSFNQFKTINDLASLRIIPLPWEYLKSIRFEKEALPEKPTLVPLTTKGQLWLYSLELPKESQGKYLVLPQSYDSGWVAITKINGKPKILNHVMIDNWANGWQTEEEPEKVIFIFWPQVLEFIGFLLLAVAFILLL